MSNTKAKQRILDSVKILAEQSWERERDRHDLKLLRQFEASIRKGLCGTGEEWERVNRIAVALDDLDRERKRLGWG